MTQLSNFLSPELLLNPDLWLVYQEKENPMDADTTYVVDVLLHVTSESAKTKNPSELKPAATSLTKDKGEMVVVPIKLNLIRQISSVKIFIPKDLRTKESRIVVLKSLQVRKWYILYVPRRIQT